jgi:MFS family permease
VTSGIAAQLVNRVGVKPVLIVGMSALTGGLVYFSQVSVDGSYWTDLFPGLLLVAVGLGFSFVPISIAALAGVQPAEAGLASGLLNTSQQIGGALGIAALSAIATSTTTSDLSTGTTPAFALTNGFQDAFIAGAIIAFVGVLVSIFVVSRRDLTEEVPEAEPAFEQAA